MRSLSVVVMAIPRAFVLDKRYEGAGSDCPIEGYYLRQQTNKLSRPVGNCTSGNGVLNVKYSITGQFPVETI